VGKMKSKFEELPVPEWLTGIGSETLEQWLAFRDWMRGSGGSSLDDKNHEIIKQGWLPIIRGEHKKLH